MSIADIVSDVQRITQDFFSSEVTFITPDDSVTVTVSAILTKKNFSIDLDTGKRVDSESASCLVHEKVLSDAGYPIRISEKLNILRHKIQWVDANGITYNFRVERAFPNSTTGLITLQLSIY